MNYIENTYICLAAPLLLAILILRREGRRALCFTLAGMTVCLLSAYISAYFSGVTGVGPDAAAYEISPVVEEVMKSLPLLFYILIYEPDRKAAITGALMTSVGFATFENVCFLTSYGTSGLLRIVIRGFGTGAMHVVCGMAVALGLYFLWDQVSFRIVGTFALLCLVTTFHALFNIFVNQSGAIFWIGSAVPLTAVTVYLIFFRRKVRLPY